MDIDFVVAPYEADAQMAFLDRIGEVAAIISEDSDMLLFGCKRILYKLDKTGYADEICLEDIGHTRDIELSGFSLERFRGMCILSGCDYLDALPGFGLKTCHKYFQKYKTAKRVLEAIKAEFPAKVPEDFESRFEMAELTFCHQRVYDHKCQELVHLHPVPEDLILSESSKDYGNWDFVGPHIDHITARGIAEGLLDPVSFRPFVELNTSSQESLETAIETIEPPKKIIKSRFFKSMAKEEHYSQQERRLTIKPTPLLDQKENIPALASSRTFSTLAQNQKSFSSKYRPKPIRINCNQPSIFSFLKKRS